RDADEALAAARARLGADLEARATEAIERLELRAGEAARDAWEERLEATEARLREGLAAAEARLARAATDSRFETESQLTEFVEGRMVTVTEQVRARVAADLEEELRRGLEASAEAL